MSAGPRLLNCQLPRAWRLLFRLSLVPKKKLTWVPTHPTNPAHLANPAPQTHANIITPSNQSPKHLITSLCRRKATKDVTSLPAIP